MYRVSYISQIHRLSMTTYMPSATNLKAAGGGNNNGRLTNFFTPLFLL